MMTITLQNWQLKGNVPLSVEAMCVSFNLSVLAGIHTVTDRIKNLILKIMIHVDALVLQYGINTNDMNAITIFLASGAVVEIATGIVVNYPDPITVDSLAVATKSAVTSYGTGQGYIIDNFVQTFSPEWTSAVNAFASNLPQAAITDCPADAVTNYNVVTTLLGSLTGAVNTANTKQNQIATQFNNLLAELRTLKIIAV